MIFVHFFAMPLYMLLDGTGAIFVHGVYIYMRQAKYKPYRAF